MRHAHDKHSTIVNTEHWVFIDNGWGVEEMTHTQGGGQLGTDNVEICTLVAGVCRLLQFVNTPITPRVSSQYCQECGVQVSSGAIPVKQ